MASAPIAVLLTLFPTQLAPSNQKRANGRVRSSVLMGRKEQQLAGSKQEPNSAFKRVLFAQ